MAYKNLVYLKKDLFKDKKAHFVLDEEKMAVDPKKINKLNYSQYFRITDLEQGCLGKIFILIQSNDIH